MGVGFMGLGFRGLGFRILECVGGVDSECNPEHHHLRPPETSAATAVATSAPLVITNTATTPRKFHRKCVFGTLVLTAYCI